MRFLYKLLPILIVIALSYWAVKPLSLSGFFPIHDDTQVQRVFEMHKALADGMFPVRWVSDLGYNYGYPIFNFYAPLAYYFGGFFMLVGLDALAATKIMMSFGIILAGVGMYFFAKEFWGKMGGVAAALLYVYAPYHAVQVYVRGDVAEFWAYAFIPLAFWGVYKVYAQSAKVQESNSARTLWSWIAVGSISYAGIILSHNLTAMMVTPFLFSFASVLVLFRRAQMIRLSDNLKIFSPLFLGILLASFYWLPTLSEMKYTNVLSVVGGGSDYKDHFVCPVQLWDSPWGFAGSASGCVDGMSFKVGKVHIILFLLSLTTLFIVSGKKSKEFGILLFFVITLFFSTFLMFESSKFIWDGISHMAFFQFPWRFLIMVSFCVSFLAGSASWALQTKLTRYRFHRPLDLGMVGIFVVLVVFFNAEVFNPLTIENKKVIDYTDRQWITWNTSKISDEYMPVDFNRPRNENEVPGKKITVRPPAEVVSLIEKTQRIEAVIETQGKTDVVFNIAYFPAWQMYIDGKRTSYKKFNKGLIVEIPSGKHTVVAVFEQTFIEQLANLLSMAGVIILIIGIIRKRKYEKSS